LEYPETKLPDELMKLQFLLSILATSALSACVSNKAVQTVQAGDADKSCPQLAAELSTLGASFEEAKDDSGVTGKNVGLAIVFWPGIIVNEVRANKNQDSIDQRVSHLTAIYNEKCTGTRALSDGGSLTEKLEELKRLHEQNLINDSEYEEARKRVLNGS
jgi:hypothetical protein